MKLPGTGSPLFLIAVSAMICVASALAIVYTRHESRRLFVELESLTAERDRLNIEWGQLQIEQSTWATHARIEQVAREALALSRPRPADIYVITRDPAAARRADGQPVAGPRPDAPGIDDVPGERR